MIALLFALSLAHATPADPIEAALYSAMATGDLIMKLSNGPQPGTKSPPEIFGQCYLIRAGKPTGHVCPNTYIQFKNLISGDTTRVWISSSDGRFSFPFKEGQKFELQAFVGGEAHSNPITVSKAFRSLPPPRHARALIQPLV